MARWQLLYAYPHYGRVNISNVPIGGQSYHSLQVKGRRRYRNGLAAQGSYTWGKSRERVSILNAQSMWRSGQPMEFPNAAPPNGSAFSFAAISRTRSTTLTLGGW